MAKVERSKRRDPGMGLGVEESEATGGGESHRKRSLASPSHVFNESKNIKSGVQITLVAVNLSVNPRNRGWQSQWEKCFELSYKV